MPQNIFQKRESALEYEFFHRVDEQLLARLRAKLDFEKQEQALADATGIHDEAVLEELAGLGIGAETIFAMSLFPLVWVAWADGNVEETERRAILEAAHSAGHERDTASHELIDRWLDHEPDADLMTAWKDYVGALCATLTEESRQTLKQDVMDRTRAVAKCAGGVLGFHRVSAAQNEILEEVEAAFE